MYWSSLSAAEDMWALDICGARPVPDRYFILGRACGAGRLLELKAP